MTTPTRTARLIACAWTALPLLLAAPLAGAQTEAPRYVDIELGRAGGGCGITQEGTLRCWGASACDADVDRETHCAGRRARDRSRAMEGLGRIRAFDLTFSPLALRAESGEAARYVPGRPPEVVSTDAVAVSQGFVLERDGTVRSRLGRERFRVPSARSFGARHAGWGEHVCVVRRDRAIVCTAPDHPTELRPVRGVRGAVAVQVAERGVGYACAIVRGGRVRCWGDAPMPPWSTRESAAAVPGLRDVVQLALGHDHACARTEDGEVRCWASNYSGAIDPTRPDRDDVWPPVRVGAIDDAIDVAVGLGRTCVVRRSGEALCQGDRQRARPTRVRSIAPVRQLVPYPGSSVSPAWLALTADGVLHFWGRTPTRSSATPTPIARGVEQLFAGSHSVIARFRDGVARRIVLHEGAIDWVEGIYGETIELPALVGAVGPRRQVCAWTQAGAVLCRGRGLEQVGVDREDEWTRIEGLGGVEEVVSFGEGFCARSGEAVHCWGHRLLFEGNGDPPPAGLYRMPGRFTQLQASFRRVLATRTDGYAEAWGMIGSREQPRVVPDEGEPADGVWLLAGGEVVFARSGRLRLVRRSGSEPLHVTVSGARVVQGLPHGAARCALDGEGRVFCWGEGVALGLSDRFSRVGL